MLNYEEGGEKCISQWDNESEKQKSQPVEGISRRRTLGTVRKWGTIIWTERYKLHKDSQIQLSIPFTQKGKVVIGQVRMSMYKPAYCYLLDFLMYLLLSSLIRIAYLVYFFDEFKILHTLSGSWQLKT